MWGIIRYGVSEFYEYRECKIGRMGTAEVQKAQNQHDQGNKMALSHSSTKSYFICLLEIWDYAFARITGAV